jgi:UDP-3-O-[3-hydroxymyristoyl] glucosamine N-acyltransferase
MYSIRGFLKGNRIHKSFKHGKNLKIGWFCLIEEDVVVGDDVTICDYVVLKKGTVIGNGTFIDTGVISSGQNYIGNNVTIRYNTIIARKMHIEDEVFLSANIMNVFITHEVKHTSGTRIGRKAFIGANAVLGSDITIGPDVVIGALAYVAKDCLEPGTYVGVPAKKLQK